MHYIFRLYCIACYFRDTTCTHTSCIPIPSLLNLESVSYRRHIDSSFSIDIMAAITNGLGYHQFYDIKI